VGGESDTALAQVPTVTISVVVRIYNCERYIAQTLTSILEQTRPPDELIVVDDGSTDGSREIVMGFGDRIRLVRQTNSGHSAALNRGFREARGTYVANCDADDLWEPTKLERQVETLRAHPEIDVAFTGTVSFGLRDHTWHGVPGAGLLAHDTLVAAMYRHNVICTSSTVVRRALLDSVGEFSTRFVTCEDCEFWMRALRARSAFYFDPEILVRHREHSAAATGNRLRILRDTHMVHLENGDLADAPASVRSIAAADLNQIGRALVEAGELPVARATFRESLGRKPTLFALGWIATLSLPRAWRHGAIRAVLGAVRYARCSVNGWPQEHSPV
jgi:glycosyltransferase involved in cell wall biosynthesis